MKLTKSKLKQIIKEEVKYLREGLSPEKEHFFKKIKGKWAKVHWPSGKETPKEYIKIPANKSGFPYDDYEERQETLDTMAGQKVQEDKSQINEMPYYDYSLDYQAIMDALMAIVDNYGVAVYPAVVASVGAAAKEVADAVKNKGKKVDEKKLTEPEKEEKERIAKGMKKNKDDFKDRYGKDAESVMYATATKIAKEKA